MKIGKKPIIWVAILAIIIGGALLHEYVQKQELEEDYKRRAQYQQEQAQREQELIQIVQETEIGDGVRLVDGVLAYCGSSGDWSAFNSTVFLEVYGDNHWIEASFEVNEETEIIDIMEFDSDMHPANSDELDNIIHDMILAAS